jgi:hypothetical protein
VVLSRAMAGPVALVVVAACSSGAARVATPVTTSSRPPAVTSTTATIAATPPSTTTSTSTRAARSTTSLTPAITPAPATTAAPTTSAAPATVHITQADSGHAFTVPVGGTVVVTLASGELWAEPVSSSPALTRVTAGVNTSTGNADATFSAVSKGVAKISSDHRCLPRPGQACAMYIALWSVTVTVT